MQFSVCSVSFIGFHFTADILCGCKLFFRLKYGLSLWLVRRGTVAPFPPAKQIDWIFTPQNPAIFAMVALRLSRNRSSVGKFFSFRCQRVTLLVPMKGIIFFCEPFSLLWCQAAITAQVCKSEQATKGSAKNLPGNKSSVNTNSHILLPPSTQRLF